VPRIRRFKVLDQLERGATPVPGKGRVLPIVFPDRETFRRQYEENISNGGVFVATDEFYAPGERVRIRLDLDFCAESMSLAADVVQWFGPDTIEAGGVPGVALKLVPDLATIRVRLGPLATGGRIAAVESAAPDVGERRSAPRSEARVRAVLHFGDGEQCEGWSRDLSTGGALVSTLAHAPCVDEEVEVTLRLRAMREIDVLDDEHSIPEMTIPGVVRRQLEGEGGQVLAVGVQFLPPPDRAEEMLDFLCVLKSTEQIRRPAEVSGSIEVLPVPDLVQSLARSTHEGTLTLLRGGELGMIMFRDGRICGASLGAVGGRKAIVRMLMWEDGRFEFESTLPSGLPSGEGDPIEWVLMEGLRLVDEMRRPGRPCFDLLSRMRLTKQGARESGEDFDKLDSALIELARVNTSLHRVVDAIAEPDPEIYDRIAELLSLELIKLDR